MVLISIIVLVLGTSLKIYPILVISIRTRQLLIKLAFWAWYAVLKLIYKQSKTFKKQNNYSYKYFLGDGRGIGVHSPE